MISKMMLHSLINWSKERLVIFNTSKTKLLFINRLKVSCMTSVNMAAAKIHEMSHFALTLTLCEILK